VPGTPVSELNHTADTVVVAARYGPQAGELLLAQAYERRGVVWTDVILLDRDDLLARVRSRRRIYAGEVRPDIPGAFTVHGRLQMVHDGARTYLTLGKGTARGDDLGVPLF